VAKAKPKTPVTKKAKASTPVRSAPAKIAPVKPAPVKSSKNASIKPAAVKAVAAKTVAAKIGVAKTVVAKRPPTRVSPVKASPAKVSPAKLSLAKTAPLKTPAAKQGKTAGSKAEPVKPIAKPVPGGIIQKPLPSHGNPVKNAPSPTLKNGSKSSPPKPAVVQVPKPVAPPAPPTSERRLKNTAGLSERDIEHFRDLLLAKRRDILGDMTSMEREALREASSDLSSLPMHMADQGTDAYEQEFTLNLVEKDRQLLREINNALVKIQNGTYGLCEGTQKPISKQRLEFVPWAKYSIEYAQELERRQLRR
jgi:DnaK suppressor protein